MTDSDRLYVELTRRLAVINVGAAGAITALTLLAVWGNWHHVGLVAIGQGAIMAFNVWIDHRVLGRWDARRAETLRTAVNLTAMTGIGSAIGWPIPTWCWLPFTALVIDGLLPRIAWTVLIANCVVQGTAALLGGVPWTIPTSVIVTSLLIAGHTKMRFGAMRDMLHRSDQQRAELAGANGALETAHAALREANQQLQREVEARAHAELELRQAQKLESVGRLAAGIAHEINTPVQFVGDNLQFTNASTADLVALVAVYRDAFRAIAGGADVAELAPVLAEAEERCDLAYVTEHLPEALGQSETGIERITAIVRSVKDFAHPDRGEVKLVDINAAVQSTLTLARFEYKDVADVVTELGALPLVACNGGEINQVILNLVVNAAHAIGDGIAAGRPRGRIVVTTRPVDDGAIVQIRDTGVGIPPAIHDRIFDPFFTTKEIGRGTGQGLAIAHAVIRKHGGTITFASEVGVGTTFTIRLPVRGDDRSLQVLTA
jgi:signal transduction histidine kinase